MRIIFIMGMARSGTSWLGKIFASHPEVLYHFEPFDEKPERAALPVELRFWNLVEKIEKVDQDREAVRRNMLSVALHRFWEVRGHALDRAPFFPQPPSPRMMAIKSPKLASIAEVCATSGQVLYIVRDPRAMVASLWSTEFGKCYHAAHTADNWVRWTNRFLDLADANPALFAVLKYEDLANHPHAISEQLFAWCDLAWREEVEAFIEHSQSAHDDDPYAVRKLPQRVLDRWRDELSAGAGKIIMDAVRGSRAAVELYNDFKE